MRLINTSTLKLEEFSEEDAPPYAILSHTWGNDSEELTFRQVVNGETDKGNLGSIKLRGCCRQAQKEDLGYAWIDTCCIDKTNLVELSEAINSMYRWYNRASVCYAYLSDVPDNDDPPRPGSKFRSSRWFQRGWTLQELLAPKHLRFYNAEWRSIGTKGTICTVIKNITRVPQQYLLGIASLHGASVAQRMSWAAQRRAKRAEDIAYCLLGIFNVTMPMIYGEGGEQAFFRLQEQIMKTTRDDSILAWGLSDGASKPSMNDSAQVMGGEILAVGPSSFANSAQIVARNYTSSPLHSLDVFGGSVRVHMPLLTTSGGETYGLLSCGPGSNKEQVVGIPLVRVDSGASNEYIRPMGRPSVLQPITAAGSPPELIHIKRDGQRDASATKDQRYWIYDDDLFAQLNLALVAVEPPSCWDKQMNLISAIRSDDVVPDAILLRFSHSKGNFVMMLETTPASNGDPQFHLVTCSRDTPLPQLAESHRVISSKASGRTSASNGNLHLRITLDPDEEGLISINPHPMDKPPDVTIDVSEEVEKWGLVAEFTQLLKERRQEKEREVELHARSKLHEDILHLAKKERKAVEDQIKQLEDRRSQLVAEENESASEVHALEKQLAASLEIQEETSVEASRAFKRLADLRLFEDLEMGSTLFQEAETLGDAEVLKLFSEEGLEAVLMSKYGASLIAASSRGDVDMVAQLLATGEADIDRKDSIYGRTALGWASANGHEAVVQLLLETDKVDVNTTDNNGWSPLRCASERNYEGIIRLLIDWGARIGYQMTIQCQTDIVSSVASSHGSTAAASMSPDDHTRIWDSSTGKCQETVENRNIGVYSVAFSSDSKMIASGSMWDTVKIWDSITGKRIRTLSSNRVGQILSVAFSNDSKRLISGTRYYFNDTWDLRTGKCLNSFGSSGGQLCVAISPDSRLVASGLTNNTIKIWTTTDTGNKCLRTLQGHDRSVQTVAFSPDCKFIASGSYDAIIKIWEVETGGCLQTLEGHSRGVSSVVFSHDSKMLASGAADKTVHIWDVLTGIFQKLEGHRDGVTSVAFSHDARMLASGSSDSTIRLWDVTNGNCLQVLEGHCDGVLSVAFSHDSTRLASGSSDGTLKIWDISILLTMLSPSGVNSPTAPLRSLDRRPSISESLHSADGTIEYEWRRRPSPSESLHSADASRRPSLSESLHSADGFSSVERRQRLNQDPRSYGSTDDFTKEDQEIADILKAQHKKLEDDWTNMSIAEIRRKVARDNKSDEAPARKKKSKSYRRPARTLD